MKRLKRNAANLTALVTLVALALLIVGCSQSERDSTTDSQAIASEPADVADTTTEQGFEPEYIGGVVDFYGLHAEARPDWTSMTAPLLAIFAGDDAAIPKPAVRSLEAELGRAGIRARVEIRDGLRHGFMNPARADVFDAVAAAESWDAMLAFLRAELS